MSLLSDDESSMGIPEEEEILIPLHGSSSTTSSTIDDTNLIHIEAHIHHSSSSSIGAIISHPYGPLGGDLHNNVVRHVTYALANKGLSTLRYNMRGVGKSTKKTSWTGQPETSDLIQLIRWWIHAKEYRHGCFYDSNGMPCPRCAPTKFIIIGYSYGALISIPTLIQEDISKHIVAFVSISLPSKMIPLLTFFHSHFFYPPLPPNLPKLFILGDNDPFTSPSHFMTYLSTLCGTTSTTNIVDGGHSGASLSLPTHHSGMLMMSTTTTTTTMLMNADVIVVPKLDHFMIGKEATVVMNVVKWIENILKQVTKTEERE